MLEPLEVLEALDVGGVIVVAQTVVPIGIVSVIKDDDFPPRSGQSGLSDGQAVIVLMEVL